MNNTQIRVPHVGTPKQKRERRHLPLAISPRGRGAHVAGVALLLLTFMLAGCRPADEHTGIVVAATIFPLAKITEELVQDEGVVHQMLPPGSDPHTHEPQAGNLIALQEADLLVTIGVGFEHIEHHLLEDVPRRTPVLDASQDVPLLPYADDHGHEHEDEHEDEHEGEEGAYDPHFWLSPAIMAGVTGRIADELAAIDPENGDIYKERADTIIQELTGLDDDFRSSAQNCAKDVIVVDHNAYQYLSSEYTFEVAALTSPESEIEPTPDHLVEVVETIIDNSLEYILYTAGEDTRTMSVLAEQTNAKLIPFDILETGASDDGTRYSVLLRNNLQALRTALGCSPSN